MDVEGVETLDQLLDGGETGLLLIGLEEGHLHGDEVSDVDDQAADAFLNLHDLGGVELLFAERHHDALAFRVSVQVYGSGGRGHLDGVLVSFGLLVLA